MPSQGGSTRWCPTPEQLMILEEMYRGGLRTPNASQIQQITAHLAFYGRIEGKNVFYWFQNHKARDRQKLRRRLCMSHHLLSFAHYYAAAAAGHQLLGATTIAGAPPPLCTPTPAPHYSYLDQQAAAAHLTTSPAAAYTSYYYPFGAAPASRCTGATPSPLFQYQGEGGGVLPEAMGRSGHSLGKLDNFGVVEDTSGCPASTVVDMPPPSGYKAATMEAAGEAISAPSTAFCRPLKTLDLFPGGLKEEQRDVV